MLQVNKSLYFNLKGESLHLKTERTILKKSSFKHLKLCVTTHASSSANSYWEKVCGYCTLKRNEGIGRRLVFFSWASRGIVKVCSLMQCLFSASNSPCSPFLSLPNPSLGTLSPVTPGYGIWSLLLVPFLQSLCHLSIHPRGKAFHLKMPQLLVSCRGQAWHAYCNPTQTYTQTQSLYTHLWVCKFIVCLTERQFKDPTQHRYEDTWNNFSLKVFARMYEKGQIQQFMWSWLNFTAAQTDKLTPTTLNIGLKCFPYQMVTAYSLFKKSWKIKLNDESTIYHGTQQY